MKKNVNAILDQLARFDPAAAARARRAVARPRRRRTRTTAEQLAAMTPEQRAEIEKRLEKLEAAARPKRERTHRAERGSQLPADQAAAMARAMSTGRERFDCVVTTERELQLGVASGDVTTATKGRGGRDAGSRLPKAERDAMRRAMGLEGEPTGARFVESTRTLQLGTEVVR